MMANNEGAFFKVAESNWWGLRELFKRTVPATVSPTYVSTALSMSPRSASSNLIAPLKRLGILDPEGKPTDLAYDWRDDAKYADVCGNLLKEFYPQELRDLFPGPEADTERLKTWFMNQARCGEPAARMFATFYKLLLRADPKEGERQKQEAKPSTPPPAPRTARSQPKKQEAPDVGQTSDPSGRSGAAAAGPSTHGTATINPSPQLHVNIQLHISPEATAEQIDKIFESMARHLGKLNGRT
jgi:hypothetical protein